MPLQASGRIKLSEIATQFGGSGSHKLSEYYRGGANVEDTNINGNIPASGTNKLIYTVPANSVILQGYFLVQTAFAGGTSYDIDFVTSAGAAIGTGSDKLWDGLLLAEIDSSAVGTAILSSTHTGTNSGNVLAGYAAGAECILASAGQLKVAATGTFTAGVAQIIVQYIDAPALLAA